ncbi:hypothetical protein BJ508DRAFT_339111 [Ascobolus immersus RN42]|uniref:Uncharacterized protein n=1 Tax=Ascobolus immersus RN42 TaxID=1160509 RepID=A0A3N4HPJ7_ASCIM|nr:hypothetical protein BJ508DRAFT_339111 [Ascobolus immersus RN42]
MAIYENSSTRRESIAIPSSEKKQPLWHKARPDKRLRGNIHLATRRNNISTSSQLKQTSKLTRQQHPPSKYVKQRSIRPNMQTGTESVARRTKISPRKLNARATKLASEDPNSKDNYKKRITKQREDRESSTRSQHAEYF